jgi:hypothetical protein
MFRGELGTRLTRKEVVLLELQLDDPVINLGEWNFEWYLRRSIEYEMRIDHLGYPATILSLVQQRGM